MLIAILERIIPEFGRFKNVDHALFRDFFNMMIICNPATVYFNNAQRSKHIYLVYALSSKMFSRQWPIIIETLWGQHVNAVYLRHFQQLFGD